MAKTLFEKIWDKHVVKELPGGEVLLYIDRHLIHEVTSPQAFEGLKITTSLRIQLFFFMKVFFEVIFSIRYEFSSK